MSKIKILITILVGINLAACSLSISRNGSEPEPTFEPSATVPMSTGVIASPDEAGTPTAIPVSTSTPAPTATQAESNQLTPTASDSMGDTQISEGQDELPPYIVQPGSPVVAQNFVRPELGCSFLGVGGQVFDIDSNPVKGLVVEAQGSLDGEEILRLSLTGSAPNLGPGGFVIQLAQTPHESEKDLRVQLFDLEGNALSEKVAFPTYSDCNKNFILINFMEISADLPVNEFFMPLIMNR